MHFQGRIHTQLSWWWESSCHFTRNWYSKSVSLVITCLWPTSFWIFFEGYTSVPWLGEAWWILHKEHSKVPLISCRGGSRQNVWNLRVQLVFSHGIKRQLPVPLCSEIMQECTSQLNKWNRQRPQNLQIHHNEMYLTDWAYRSTRSTFARSYSIAQ
jgi:hypothetical protein